MSERIHAFAPPGRTWCALALLALTIACSGDEGRLEEHRQRGREYLEASQYSEAIIEYKNVLQIDPNLAEAHYGLARAYLGAKQARQAYWELQETIRLDPANHDARLQYAQFLLFGKEDELNQALEHADAVIVAVPDRAAAYIVRGRALQALKRQEEAQEAYEKAVAKAPEDSAPLLLLANFHRQEGDAETAEGLYRKLTEVEPSFASHAALAGFLASDPSRGAETESAYREALSLAKEEERVAAYSVLANYLYARERYADAETVLLEGIESGDEELDLRYALARFYNAQGDTAKADQVIEDATSADPEDPRPYLVLSAYRGRQGDLDGALEAAEQALSAAPEDLRAKLRKAELLVDLGYRNKDAAQLASGRAIVDAVLAGDPERPEALFVKAKIHIAEGEYDDATAALRRATEGRPDWAQAHFLLGSTLYLQRDINGARAEVVRALEIDADLIEAQKILTRIHSASGEEQLAVEVGQRVLGRVEDPALRIVVAQSLVRLRRVEDARKQLEEIPADERSAEADFAYGRVLALTGDASGARAALESANAKDPGRFEILRALLDLDMREQRLPESLARIQSAVEADSDNAKLVQLEGEALLYAGDGPGAERTLRRAIELDPNDFGAYEKLARYLAVAGRSTEILATYESALEQNKDSGTFHLMMGSLYEIHGRTDEAIERYDSAVQLDPNLAIAKNNLAYLLAESGGDLDRALDLAQEAKELLPDNPNTADTLGWVLYKKNVPSAAIGYLREAERGMEAANPNLGIVRQHLALAYQANGEASQAREVIDRALADWAEIFERASGAGQEPAEPTWVADLQALRGEVADAPAGTPSG